MEHLMYKNFKLRVRNKLLNILFGLHFQPRHWVHTVKYSLEDTGMPSQRLLDLTKEAYEITMENNLESIKSSRMKEGINHIELEQISTFPGAHYRILNGIVRSLNPKRVVEIGTWTGQYDPMHFVCSNTSCKPFNKDGLLFYRDDDHMSMFGAEEIAKEIMDKILTKL